VTFAEACPKPTNHESNTTPEYLSIETPLDQHSCPKKSVHPPLIPRMRVFSGIAISALFSQSP
jgi:hypothetical protein